MAAKLRISSTTISTIMNKNNIRDRPKKGHSGQAKKRSLKMTGESGEGGQKSRAARGILLCFPLFSGGRGGRMKGPRRERA
jgi:hypothetical protein